MVLIGVVMALAVGAFAMVARLDRERGFYPTVTIVIASYYVLFAVMGGSPESLVPEIGLGLLFMAAATYGFHRSSWVVVAALSAHGIQDLFHSHLVSNPGVPAWWPEWCAAYDVTAALFLAWRLGAREKGRFPGPGSAVSRPD